MEIKKWEQLIDLNKHNSLITTLTVTLDGNHVISGSKDKTLRIWDLKTEKLLYILTGHSAQVSSVAVIPKSNHIISGSLDRTLKIWNIKNSNKVLHLKSGSETIHNIFCLILGIFLFILYLKIVLLLVMTFFEKITFDSYMGVCVLLFLVLMLAILIYYLIIKIRDKYNDKYNCNKVNKVIITLDGRKAISALRNKTLEVWNLTEQKKIFVLRGHRDWITSIALISDDYLISGSRDKTLKVWNLKTRKDLFTLVGHTAPVTSVAVTPNGSQIISASSDGVLKIWNLETREEIRSLNNHHNSVEAIAVTPDGQYLVSASADHTLKVWDLLSGEERTSFTADSPLTCCTVAPEGSTIIAGDQAGQLHFLRLEKIQALS